MILKRIWQWKCLDTCSGFCSYSSFHKALTTLIISLLYIHCNYLDPWIAKTNGWQSIKPLISLPRLSWQTTFCSQSMLGCEWMNTPTHPHPPHKKKDWSFQTSRSTQIWQDLWAAFPFFILTKNYFFCLDEIQINQSYVILPVHWQKLTKYKEFHNDTDKRVSLIHRVRNYSAIINNDINTETGSAVLLF